MLPVAEADVHEPATEQADHHRLDHIQGEQRRDRRIDGVAAGGQHLSACGRGQRVIGDDHAAMAGRRPLLAVEGRTGSVPPGARCHEIPLWKGR